MRDSSNLSDTGKLIGRVFDNRYQIVELIGRGGMSAVYKGIQLSMGKTVAVKVMARSLAEDERLLQRFNQEALASSRLRHPNTIKVFDYGQSDDGHLFLAMELLEGRTLGQVIRTDAPMDPLRTCKIARQVCKSLAEAHRAGIVHRDLKPDNVFLSDIYGEKDFVKVLDFGIAKFITEGSQETLTQTGFICGTPLYLSPEQGLARTLDHRTDLYSLGIILYEMLTGITPFRADTPIGVVMKHIHEPVPPFRAMNPGARVPGGLEALVLQLLEKEPERRPGSADEVGATLDELLSSPDLRRAPRATPPPPPSRAAGPSHTLPPPPPSSHTLIAKPVGVAGRVLSMHMNERPTMYLPADQVPPKQLLADPGDVTDTGAAGAAPRTEALPEPAFEHDDDDPNEATVEWHDRTMLLSPDHLAPDADDDPDRTEFLPVIPEPVAPPESTRLLTPEELPGPNVQDMTTSGVPGTASRGGWIWAVAAVLLLAGGAVVYFATDWLRSPESPAEPSVVAQAGGDADQVAETGGEGAVTGREAKAPAAPAEAPAAKRPAAQPAEARPAAGPGNEPAKAPPTAPGPPEVAELPTAGAAGEVPAVTQPAAQVPTTAPAADLLKVTVTTVPPGAEVIDGVELRGTTPLDVTVPRHGAARSLHVRLAGHEEEVVLVDPLLVRTGTQIEVKLTPTGQAAAKAPEAPAPAPAPVAEGSASAGQGKTAEAAEATTASTGSKASSAKTAPAAGADKKTQKKPKTPKRPKDEKKPSKKPKGGDMEWKDW